MCWIKNIDKSGESTSKEKRNPLRTLKLNPQLNYFELVFDLTCNSFFLNRKLLERFSCPEVPHYFTKERKFKVTGKKTQYNASKLEVLLKKLFFLSKLGLL